MTPVVEFGLIAPLLAVLIGALVSVLAEAFVPRGSRYWAQAIISLVTLVVALGYIIVQWTSGSPAIAVMGAVSVDRTASFLWLLVTAFGLLSLLLFLDRQVGGGASAFTPSAATVPGSASEREAIAARLEHTEVYPLVLFAIFGMMLFSAANDLLTMFIALEILSLPLYLLSGLARRRRLLSQEAALKYFLLGALSSALFLYGVALLYGYAGSFRFSDIDAAISGNRQSNALLLAGLGLVTVGLLFKLGAVPFHSWIPDVYTGAPTPVTAFMSVCTKIAAVGGLARLLYVAVGGLRWDWQLVLAVVAVLTMLVGALIGLAQTDVKRLLAYSSIAHAGFILVAVTGAVTATSGQVGSVAGALFYLAAYGFATLGAFAVVTLVRRAGGEATGLEAWGGIGRRNPLLGALMTVFLLSLAGIPLTGGFIGKVVAFVPAWTSGYQWLVVVAVLASLITAAFYFRVIGVMFFAPDGENVDVVTPGTSTWIVLAVGAVGTLALGLAPSWVLSLATQAANFLR